MLNHFVISQTHSLKFLNIMPKQNKRVMKHTLMRAEKIKGKHNFHRFLLIMTVRGLSKQLSCIIHVKNVESNRFFRPHYGRVIKLNHLSTCAIYVEVICIAKIWITRNLVVILKCIFFKHMSSDFSSNRRSLQSIKIPCIRN